MKILYTNFHQNDGGGHVTYILNLVTALAASHQVSVATPGSSRLYRYARALPKVSLIDQVYTSRLGHMLPEVRRLRRFLDTAQFDLIHVNGSADHRHIMMASRGLRKTPKIVWTKHNDHPLDSFGNRLRARFATDHVIAVSRFIRHMIAESPYAGLPATTIHHGIDTRRFSPIDPDRRRREREALFGPDHDGLIVLGSSGGTDYDKGWLDLLAGIAMLAPAQQRRFRVIVAGSLPDDEKRARVQDLGVEELLVFPGLLDDVRPVLAACDIGFVLSYREALSYACREVMSMGLPALVSNVGGLPENVSDLADGWIVPPKDPAAIQAVLAAVLSSPQSVRRMGVAARRKSESEFALQRFVDRTCAVYDEVLKN